MVMEDFIDCYPTKFIDHHPNVFIDGLILSQSLINPFKSLQQDPLQISQDIKETVNQVNRQMPYFREWKQSRSVEPSI